MKHTCWLLAISMVGCALLPRGNAPSLVEDQSVQTIQPGLSKESLEEGRVAILDPSPEGAAEGMRDTLAFEVFQGFRLGFPNVNIQSRPDGDAILAEAGLGGEMTAFLREYPRSRHIDWDLLAKVAEAEQVRYLFFSRVEEVEKKTDVRMLDAGETLIRPKVTVFSSGPNMVPATVTKRVAFYGELWDLRCRAVVWAGEGRARVAEPSGEERYREEDVFISAARLLVGSFQQSVRPAEKSAKC